MEALLQKGSDVWLDDLGELLRVTKYNHGWAPNLMGGVVVISISPSGVQKKARK
jgi:hypothetical protein